MDTRFRPHNTHLEDPSSFRNLDPQLRQLGRQPLVHLPGLLARLPRDTPGIYTVGGGYLTAINDVARGGVVLPSTLAIYSDWIRGDMAKRGKQEQYLREILGAIVRRFGSQITWHSLAGDLSIEHHRTVADYVGLLESMDAVFVQAPRVEDKLLAAPKKARKVMFTDPFVLHAVRSWLHPTADPDADQIRPLLADPRWSAMLVEACVTTHFRRHHPTYYIKAAGEVDVAYVDGGRFWPIEVQWTTQLRPRDLKQIRKDNRGRILARVHCESTLEGVPVEPLPLALLRLG